VVIIVTLLTKADCCHFCRY